MTTLNKLRRQNSLRGVVSVFLKRYVTDIPPTMSHLNQLNNKMGQNDGMVVTIATSRKTNKL